MRSAPAFALALPVLLLACGPGEGAPKRPFEDGFLFGTAVAGFQADMGCPTLPASECEDPSSDWYAFVTDPRTVASSSAHLSGDAPSAGPGEWELYEADLDRASGELNNDAFRFSIEWSRIFPTATDDLEGYDALKAAANPAALAHYHALLAAARARGITPLVTLNHYTLPLWIHDGVGCHLDFDHCSPRGWVDRERTVREIAKYAGFVAREFGDEVDLWATLNEPFAVLLPGYVMPTEERSNPPAVSLRTTEAKIVLRGLVEAHARMYDAVKANDHADADGDGETSRVGVVYPVTPALPKDPDSVLDREAADHVFYLWNLAYLDAVARGVFDDDLDGVGEVRDDLVGRMDYIGINYYTRLVVEGTDGPMLPDLSPLTTFNPFTLSIWSDAPDGLYDMLKLVTERYDLPVIVTENGVRDDQDDGTAPSWIVRHLGWVQRAREEGIDVRGYFYWTLVDNYEWNHGLHYPMGLYAVDPADPTKARTARRAVNVYGRIAKDREIPSDLAATYPIE